MTCSKCQIENTKEGRFCSGCGTLLRTYGDHVIPEKIVRQVIHDLDKSAEVSNE